MNISEQELLRMAAVMVSFASGVAIESTEELLGDTYRVDANPSWDWKKHDYRLAHQPTKLLTECACGESRKEKLPTILHHGNITQVCESCDSHLLQITY